MTSAETPADRLAGMPAAVGAIEEDVTSVFVAITGIMGEELTVRLDDSNAEWLGAEADERNRSKEWVLEQAIRAARGVDSVYSRGEEGDVANASPSDEDATDHGDGESLRSRVDDLEARVAELEARESARDALAEDRYTVDDDAIDAENHAVPPRGDGRDQPSDAPHSGGEDDAEGGRNRE